MPRFLWALLFVIGVELAIILGAAVVRSLNALT